MRSRDVIGRRIVHVEHTRWYNAHLGHWQTDVLFIELDNGAQLAPVACETEHMPATSITLRKPSSRAAAKPLTEWAMAPYFGSYDNAQTPKCDHAAEAAG